MSKLRELLEYSCPRPWIVGSNASIYSDNGQRWVTVKGKPQDAQLIVTLVNAAEEIENLRDALRKQIAFWPEGGEIRTAFHALDAKLEGK